MSAARGSAPLHLISSDAREKPKDIYAADRAKAEDREHWAQVHIRSDRSPAIKLPDRIRKRMKGAGVRRERGGPKREDLQ